MLYIQYLTYDVIYKLKIHNDCLKKNNFSLISGGYLLCSGDLVKLQDSSVYECVKPLQSVFWWKVLKSWLKKKDYVFLNVWDDRFI